MWGSIHIPGSRRGTRAAAGGEWGPLRRSVPFPGPRLKPRVPPQVTPAPPPPPAVFSPLQCQKLYCRQPLPGKAQVAEWEGRSFILKGISGQFRTFRFAPSGKRNEHQPHQVVKLRRAKEACSSRTEGPPGRPQPLGLLRRVPRPRWNPAVPRPHQPAGTQEVALALTPR